jgi:hypothetical protein
MVLKMPYLDKKEKGTNKMQIPFDLMGQAWYDSMTTEKYLSYFFPFDKIDFRKKGTESSMLTDETSSLKVCKHCGSAFVAGRPNSVFCSGRCKNQYNVYKSRAKDKAEDF